MNDSLYERLEILYEAEMIDADIVEFCKNVISFMYQKSFDWGQESFEIFITHLAMAASRGKKGNAEETDNEIIIETLKSEEPEVYSEAYEMLCTILGYTSIDFSKSEKDLLIIHLCNMCKSREENKK